MHTLKRAGRVKPDRQKLMVSAARVLLVFALLFTLYEATRMHPVNLDPHDNSDKLLHAFAFYVLAFLADRGYPASRHLPRKLLFLAFFGIFIELVQVYLPWRSAEVMDFIADCIGVAVYLVPVLVVRQIKKHRNS
ncbi:MAG: VanZ family protein [Chlorobiaceae bacterium]|nr:VanZ family protein [Chlorobiaceae bacterium]